MNLNESTHFKVVLTLKDWFNKDWSDQKIKLIIQSIKSIELDEFQNIVEQICNNEKTLPPNPLPVFKEYQESNKKLDEKDAARIISNIKGKIIRIGRYRSPDSNEFNKIELTLISEFGGWIDVCDRFDDFKWFVRNSIESGIDRNGNYQNNYLEGKHEQVNKRLEGQKQDAQALNKIIEKAKGNKNE